MNYANYVDFVNYRRVCGLDIICYVGHLSTCHPCRASMKYYMLCICLNCISMLRSVEEMEKNVPRPVVPARVARQPSWNTMQMAVTPAKVA